MLQAVGGPGALQAVRGSVDDADKDVHAAAIRVLCEWKSADAAPVLLELAKQRSSRWTGSWPARLSGDRHAKGRFRPRTAGHLPTSSTVGPARRGETNAAGSATGLANAETLDLIVPYLDDPAVKREA